MKLKRDLLFTCCIAIMTVFLSGCGYAGQVDPASKNGHGSTIGIMTPSTTSLSLGSVAVGSSASQTVTVANTGNATVILSALTSTSAAFTANGPTFPENLPAGESVSFAVAFAPTTSGAASGTVILVSNASNAPTAIAVSGTGTSAAATATPSITRQPTPQVVTPGQTATFGVAASGGTLNYQWHKNGTAISGATASVYTTPPTTTADNGSTYVVAVSDNAGNVMSNPATLTVVPAASGLTASSSSLSFGSVNVGTSDALPVTFTNSGTASVTVSSVTVSGSGFNATGISAGQIVAAGQSASLSVTFDPSASGALTGSVTVASNATNSPSTVSLSGSGTAVAGNVVAGAPTCGVSGDATVHVPTNWSTFVPPAKGQSYVDATFGCTVTRVTDASTEVYTGAYYLPVTMGYATVSPFNSNDTYLMITDGWNRRFITDLQGNVIVPLANMPAAFNDGWFYWDATNPNVFYYTNGNSMMSGTIQGSSVTAATVHQFTEYTAINFMDETDISQDGAHVVVIGGDNTGSSPENVFDYDFVTNLKGPVYTTQQCTGVVNNSNNSCLHKLIQTPDNNVAIDFSNDGTGTEQGVRLWTGLNPLPHLQNSTNHMDTGYDMNGSSVYVESGNSTYTAGITNPCPSGWGLDVRQIYDPASSVCLLDNQPSWHVGYRGNANQPWVGLSFFDTRTPSPEWFDTSTNYAPATSNNWQLYEDEIMMVRIDANNNSKYVYRLALGYSRSEEDFYAQPHAAISRDGKYIAFNSNMAFAHTGCPANFQTTTNCTDVYVIKVQ